jgi:hypothetical protein
LHFVIKAGPDKQKPLSSEADRHERSVSASLMSGAIAGIPTTCGKSLLTRSQNLAEKPQKKNRKKTKSKSVHSR